MSLRAYQQAAQRSEAPRDAEYRLFAQVTRALMELKTKPREDLASWIWPGGQFMVCTGSSSRALPLSAVVQSGIPAPPADPGVASRAGTGLAA